ncbi:MAG: hypothetical protein JRN68_06905 [Nitrososphaerota archaeon]|nr:hypothetical protein [Nitrososphaerota archaeon]
MKPNGKTPFGEILEKEWIGMIRAYFQNFDFESENLPADGYWSEFDLQRDIVTRLKHSLSKVPEVFVHGGASMRPKSKPEYMESDINLALNRLKHSRLPDIMVYQRGYKRFPMICEIKYSQQNFGTRRI